MGAIIDDEQEEQIEDENIQHKNGGDRPAGSPEGEPAADPTSAEVKSLYDDLGIKAPVPTGKTKGRPKTSDVRTEDDKKEKPADTDSRKKEDDGNSGKSKNAPASDKDGDSGDDADEKGKKVGKDAAKVSDKSEEADAGVRKDKSRSEEDSERGSEENADDRAEGDESAEHDKDGKAKGESDDEEDVKRPGKSNPAVEQRFQKLTAELKARDELIEKQAKELEDTQRKQRESAVAQKDPEYTVEDFRKVRDDEGNVLELDENQAELAYRRWKDGFEQRKSEREAQFNREDKIKEYQDNAAREVMESSVKAYDTLTSILDSYPELNSKNPDGTPNPKYDKDFSAQVMPIIEEAVIYQKGTEPGNEEGYKSVIIGLRIDPTKILSAMNAIKNQKRTLPLNGTNDNVEVRSNKNVPHKGRSSDPTINAANELYQDLGIEKRL